MLRRNRASVRWSGKIESSIDGHTDRAGDSAGRLCVPESHEFNSAG